MNSLEVRSVCKTYDEGNTEVLRGLTFTVGPSEFVALYGPNGCGKSTVLNIIAGFVPPSAGQVAAPSRGAGRGGVGFIFQDFRSSLFPWLTVAQNIRLGTREPRPADAPSPADVVDLLGLTEHAKKYPYQLSGGLCQLTAIARVLVLHSPLVLMDEPLSALDYHYNATILDLLGKLHADLDNAFLMISHDVDDALLLSDRVLVLSKRPARLVGEVSVDLPSPRSSDLRFCSEFPQLRSRVFELFSEGLK